MCFDIVYQNQRIHLLQLPTDLNTGQPSNMKPQIFQQAKQTILKNKHEFITIQLAEVAKRITTLKTDNQKMKTQIKQLKSKHIHAPKISLTVRDGKQNKCVNLHKKTDDHQSDRYRNSQTEIESETTRTKKATAMIDAELNSLEADLRKKQVEKQEQLAQFEDLVKSLKKAWESRQSESSTRRQTRRVSTSFNTSNSNNQYTSKLSMDQLNDNQISVRQQTQKYLGFTKTKAKQSSQQESQVVQINERKMQAEPRRKTMSVNLNLNNNRSLNSSESVFQFGKKLRQKQSINQIDFPTKQPKSCSFSNQQDHSYSLNNSMITNSMLSHSNSRASSSFMSTRTNDQSCRKQMQGSKSYAKIVTKLNCRGCGNDYRPNEYYSHVGSCWQLEKVKLLEQKHKIEDEINQTLNLSFPHI